jgi:hypothetical protein
MVRIVYRAKKKQKMVNFGSATADWCGEENGGGDRLVSKTR